MNKTSLWLGVLAIFLIVGTVFFLYTGSNPISILRKDLSKDVSAWLWDSPDTFTKDELVKMFQIAKEENITTIYLRMDDYGDVYQIKDNEEKNIKVKKLDDAARQFITLASTYDIKVQALGGDTGWADPSERSFADVFFDGVLKYNDSNKDARFTGIQFDVESNNSTYYKINKDKTLSDYLDFIVQMTDKVKGMDNFDIGFTMPLLYSSPGNNFSHDVFDLLNETPHAYVVFMDYRNYADGVDGSIEHGKDVLDYVSKNTPNVKVIIGQETDKVSPSKITFYDTDKVRFKTETSKIVKAFESYSEFAGIAIHHLQSYIDL